MKVFEVYIAPGKDASNLLTDEVKKETGAQIMTFAEAKAVGFDGLPDPGDVDVRLIAVRDRDGPWIHRVLETSDIVAGFREHQVD